jgi:hypothetical protein
MEELTETDSQQWDCSPSRRPSRERRKRSGRLSLEPRKKAPTPLQVEAKVCALLAAWGTITGLAISDALRSELGSMLRDVTVSTKRLSSYSKAAGPRNQRLCLVPHTCRFLGQQSLGCRTDGEGLKSSLRPLSSVRGTVNPTSQSYGRVTAFLRPCSAYRAFAVEK